MEPTSSSSTPRIPGENLTFSVDDSRLVIKNESKQVITSVACKIISSSFTDKVKEFFLTLFNWKWVKVDNLVKDESGKNMHIIVNKHDLVKNLSFEKDQVDEAIKKKNLAQTINTNAAWLGMAKKENPMDGDEISRLLELPPDLKKKP